MATEELIGTGILVDNYVKVAAGQRLEMLLPFAVGDQVNADAAYRRACDRATTLRRAGRDCVRISVYRPVVRWPQLPAVGEWMCPKCAKGPHDCKCASAAKAEQSKKG